MSHTWPRHARALRAALSLSQSARPTDPVRPRRATFAQSAPPLHNPQRIFFSGASTHVGSLARLWCWARRLATGGALPARRRRREPHSGGTHRWNPPSPEGVRAARREPPRANPARARGNRDGDGHHTRQRDSTNAADEIFQYFAVTHFNLHILLFYTIHLTCH